MSDYWYGFASDVALSSEERAVRRVSVLHQVRFPSKETLGAGKKTMDISIAPPAKVAVIELATPPSDSQMYCITAIVLSTRSCTARRAGSSLRECES